MSTERDALAEMLWDLALRHLGVATSSSKHMADEVLAAGYRKPRTITTAEELDALPVGSVVRMSGTSEDARVAVKDGIWKGESEWFVADRDEWCLDSTELDDLPATVLYEPEPQP